MGNPFKSSSKGETKKSKQSRRFFSWRPKTPTSIVPKAGEATPSTTQTTTLSAPIVGSVGDDVEIVVAHRDIKRNLFPEPLRRDATAKSVEVTSEGHYLESQESYDSETDVLVKVHSTPVLSSTFTTATTLTAAPETIEHDPLRQSYHNTDNRKSDTKQTSSTKKNHMKVNTTVPTTANAASTGKTPEINDLNSDRASSDSTSDRSEDTIDLPEHPDGTWYKNKQKVAPPKLPFEEGEEENISVIEPASSMEQSSTDSALMDLHQVDSRDSNSRPFSPDTVAPEAICVEGQLTQEQLGKQLLGAFCADDEVLKRATTMQKKIREISVSQNPVQRLAGLFYDQTCAANPNDDDEDYNEEDGRPYYDEDFTLRFIHRMVGRGAALLYLQAPGSAGNNTNDWKGRTVAMLLEKGSTNPNQHDYLQPRISWTTVIGGQTGEAMTTSIDILDIMSIQSSQGRFEVETDLKDLCLFTITTTGGDVYMFEANSDEERDSIVNGLKNVISRLSFQLIVGDVSAVQELYMEDETPGYGAEASGNLPSLRNAMHSLNRVAHVFLDS